MQNAVNELYSDFIAKRTYARWMDKEQKRESWTDSVGRFDLFVSERVPKELLTEYHDAVSFIYEKQVMPSMRFLWSAGPAAEENNLSIYNCAYLAMDEPAKFGEMLYVLMHGTGVGFSVERQFIGNLPTVPSGFQKEGGPFLIDDSKLGWKLAYDHCVRMLFDGYIPSFDYSLIRPKGSRLKTFGGRSSGPAPLKQLIEFTIRIFSQAAGKKLNSIEVHDICCTIANCVVVGGVRRSACISFSNLSDQRMKHAKDGQFWLDNPQRAMANNSVAYTDKPDCAIFTEEWLNLMRSGSGERGIINVSAVKEKGRKFNRENLDNLRLNPCFTGDMKLLTEYGYKTFEWLNGKDFKVVALDGTHTQSKVWCSGEKEVVSINFQNKEYKSITCTPNHVFMLADGGECEAKDLKGKRVSLHTVAKNSFNRKPFMAGFIQGDGGTGRLKSKNHAGLEINIGINDLDIAKMFNAEPNGHTWYSVEAKEIAKEYNLSSNSLPERAMPEYQFSNYSDLADFLSGLWSANGSVIGGHRIAFKSTCKELVSQLQTMLKEKFNIDSYITNNKAKKIMFSNGEYLCKPSYDLNINRLKSICKFAKKISFGQQYKRTALEQLIVSKSPVVSSVKPAGKEKVYDFTEPKFHWGYVEDIVVHNCSEAILQDRGLCNLTEVVVRPKDTVDTLKNKIAAAVLIGCLQSTYTHLPHVSPKWKENAEKERLLGVSLTGVCDNPLFRRVDEKTKEVLRELRSFAHTCAAKFAKVLNISEPKQITLVKPSGTVSQLVNSSSGLHPRYSDYYVRRVRVNAKDPIARLLVDKHVPWNYEVGQTEEEHNTLVFDFPMKSPRGSVNRHQWTAIEQLEYWKMFNDNWSDGNPSVTIYVAEDEWVEVGAWVYKNWNTVCGISFLPKDSGVYQLAPYEELDEAQYHEEVKKWKNIHIDFDKDLLAYEIDDTTEGAKTFACTGGSCEL